MQKWVITTTAIDGSIMYLVWRHPELNFIWTSKDGMESYIKNDDVNPFIFNSRRDAIVRLKKSNINVRCRVIKTDIEFPQDKLTIEEITIERLKELNVLEYMSGRLYAYDSNDHCIFKKESNIETRTQYNSNGDIIRRKISTRIIIDEEWEYDDMKNLIHYKDSTGYEIFQKFNDKKNITYRKDSNGIERWYEYSDDGKHLICERCSDGSVHYY